MGSCMSCSSSCSNNCRRRRWPWSSSSSSNKPCFKGVRVVHLSGYVEEFEEPITVRQVTGGKPPSKHFVCSSAHLLSFGSKPNPPLTPDAELQPGHFYFLLPHSIFQSDSSPLDLVSLATRLTAIAMRGPPSLSRTDSSTGGTIALATSSELLSSVSIKGKEGVDPLISPSLRSWKPVLETIEEKSFDRRSDLSKDLLVSC